MTESFNPVKKIRESAGVRLAVLFGAFFVFLLLTSVVSLFLDGVATIDSRSKILLMSMVQCLLAFCLPAFLTARFSSNKPMSWLHLKKGPSVKAIIGVVAVYFASMPAMEWLIEWNSGLHFPEALSSLEMKLREWENAAEMTTNSLLESHGLLSVLAGVLIIGVLTGFSEELFFRGGLQGILTKASLQKSLAVWLSAFIFSTMHFQFFGFVPRLLMGAFFGYLLVWTGSLWVPVFAHALNNSMVVVMAALTGSSIQDSPLEIADMVSWDSPWIVIASVTLTSVIIFLGKDLLFKPHNSSLWQRKQLPPVSGK